MVAILFKPQCVKQSQGSFIAYFRYVRTLLLLFLCSKSGGLVAVRFHWELSRNTAAHELHYRSAANVDLNLINISRRAATRGRLSD